MIAVTGASGKLGTLVIQGLLKKVPAHQVVAAVRTPSQAGDLRALGVQIREADYDRPETLGKALTGVDKVLLISAVIPGRRLQQHKAVVDAAVTAGVQLLAYTSLLHADTSTLALAREHKATEEYIKNSGLPYVFLRNGWYLENHTAAVQPAMQHGKLLGSSGSGRFASASRADYALAATEVLTADKLGTAVYELAGDHSFDMEELAAEISRQAGKHIPYTDLSQAMYRSVLLDLSLPEMLVDVVLDADQQAQKGMLDDSSHQLSKLIGRSTTLLAEAVRIGLAE